MSLRRFGVTIYVTDYDLASHFYCETLGLFEECNLQELEHKHHPFSLGLSRASAEAVHAVQEACRRAEGDDEPLAFFIPIDDDDLILERLRSKGVTPTSVKRYPFGVKIIVADPFGNLFMMNRIYPFPDETDPSLAIEFPKKKPL